MLAILALVIVVGGWYLFIVKTKQQRSTLVLSLCMTGIAVVIGVAGIGAAAVIHSQGLAFGAAGIALVLAINGVLMMVIHFAFVLLRKNKNLL